MTELIQNMLTGGLTLTNVWALALMCTALGLSIAATQRIKRYVAYRWVRGNQELAVNSTWCRFGTSTGFFDAMLVSISPRSVRFRAWDPKKGTFMAVQRIPILKFVGDSITILETRPENAPAGE